MPTLMLTDVRKKRTAELIYQYVGLVCFVSLSISLGSTLRSQNQRSKNAEGSHLGLITPEGRDCSVVQFCVVNTFSGSVAQNANVPNTRKLETYGKSHVCLVDDLSDSSALDLKQNHTLKTLA